MDLVAKYLKAELNDASLVDAHAKARVAAIKERQDEAYMIGGT